jgi:hypothetical protein
MVLISVGGSVNASVAGMIVSIEKSNDRIEDRTRDLLACSITPQPATLLFAANVEQAHAIL